MTLIPSGLWSIYYTYADHMIDNNQIGKLCTLLYPPVRNPCANCTINHFGGTSTNIYRHGGPAPFHGRCPLCGGNGYREEQVTGTIRLRIYHRQKDWIRVNNIVIPDADAQIIGYSSDLPNLVRSIELRVISEQNIVEEKYQLAGSPFLHGFGHNRYFIGFIKRV